jgi:glycosyltransferase involved in cell wall biosynthesis
MKIAMIGQKGMPAVQGGVERHVHDLSLKLAKNDHQVTVYSRTWYTGKKEDIIFDGVQIKHLPSIHTKHLDAITHTFLATIDAIKNKYDIIHYHGIGPSLLSWIPRIFSPKSMVVSTFHSIDRYDKKWNFLAKLIFRLAERCTCYFPHKTITISRGLQKYCLNEFYKEADYIPNGINLFEKPLSDDKIKEYNLKKNNYLLAVSRLIPTKGVHVLIKAFNEIKKENKDNEKIQNLKLAIVGGSVYTNEYVKELHKLASLNNNIIFTDFQSGETLDQLYGHSLGLVHPSFNEGLPLTVLEAMSYSKPALVSNINEHRELIDDNRFFFKENNVGELKKSILNFIELSDEEKVRVGKHNRDIIEEYYQWDKIIPNVINLYENKMITAN